MTWARIEHTWPDGSTTELEVGTDQPAHPDLLDQLTARVCTLWRETCCGADD